MNNQTQLGNEFFNSLVKLRQEKGGFNMDDVGALFLQMSSGLPTSENERDTILKDGIEQIALFLATAKHEISSISLSESDENSTQSAALHLDAIIKATEEAGHSIMDAMDTIQNAAEKMDPEGRQRIQEAVTKIYEACNFQDLTVQRVSKVIKVLNEIDVKINNMLNLFTINGIKAEPQIPDSHSVKMDAELLNGPQLPAYAPSQADIDNMFGSME